MCGVAVINRRASRRTDELPQFVALAIFDFATEQIFAAMRCASSTMTRAQSAAAISLACGVSKRDAMSSCPIKAIALEERVANDRYFDLLARQ